VVGKQRFRRSASPAQTCHLSAKFPVSKPHGNNMGITRLLSSHSMRKMEPELVPVRIAGVNQSLARGCFAQPRAWGPEMGIAVREGKADEATYKKPTCTSASYEVMPVWLGSGSCSEVIRNMACIWSLGSRSRMLLGWEEWDCAMRQTNNCGPYPTHCNAFCRLTLTQRYSGYEGWRLTRRCAIHLGISRMFGTISATNHVIL